MESFKEKVASIAILSAKMVPLNLNAVVTIFMCHTRVHGESIIVRYVVAVPKWHNHDAAAEDISMVIRET